MASIYQVSSGSSDGDPKYAKFDERKRKRMISNRESAKRSRLRKSQHMDDLLNQASKTQNENNIIAQKIDTFTQMYSAVESDNNVLRAQMNELADRLQSLNTVLHIAEEVHGLVMDIPEMPDSLLEPWRMPCPIQQITTSANMFLY